MTRYAALALPLFIGCNEYNLSTDKDAPLEPIDTGTPVIALDQPDIAVDPVDLDFGYLPEDCLSDSLTVTVSNEGDRDLEVTDIQIEGSGNANFTHDGQPQVLKPTESFQFDVEFMPTKNKAYDDASIVIYSNDPDEDEVDVELLGVGADDAIIEDLFTQNVATTSDTLWVIDNSGSMSGELTALATNFSIFINNFVALGLDYQIAVVTTDMDEPTDSGNFEGAIITPNTADPITEFTTQVDQGASGSGDERALDAAYYALTKPLINTTNAGFLRPGSVVSIIVVTDEDDGSTIGTGQFSVWLDNLMKDPALTSFSAIAGPERTGLFQMPCGAFTTGTSAEPVSRYPQVIQATGGYHINICQNNWAYSLAFLAYTSAGLRTAFELNYVPTDESQIEVYIDGQQVTSGWTYDSTTNSIVFEPASIPAPKTEVSVHYPIETECNP